MWTLNKKATKFTQFREMYDSEDFKKYSIPGK